MKKVRSLRLWSPTTETSLGAGGSCPDACIRQKVKDHLLQCVMQKQGAQCAASSRGRYAPALGFNRCYCSPARLG